MKKYAVFMYHGLGELSTKYDIPKKNFVSQMNEGSGIICDGGFLSERVFWRTVLGKSSARLKKLEAIVEEKTLLVYLHMNPEALVKRTGIILEEAEGISRSYIEEYIACNVPNKMILDVSFLPADIVLRPVLWVLDKRVRG